jgi:hypothetical protein
MPGIIQETDADNQAVFCGYKLLQKDEPVCVEDKGKSKHPMAIVLYRA